MISLRCKILERIPVYTFLTGDGNHQLSVFRYALDQHRRLIIIAVRSSVLAEKRRRSPAVIVPYNDFQSISDTEVRYKKCLKVMESVLALAEDIQSQVNLYVRIGYHINCCG